MEIKIIYTDRDIVLAVKPVGKDSEKDMPALLAAQLNIKEVFPVHRLDMAVGGLMVYALNKKAAAGLSAQIADRKMRKEYLAVVQGAPEADSGLMQDLLYRDRTKNKSYVVKRRRAGVKDASLEYRCLERAEDMSLVHILLHTGRSHQIRVQFSSRKMPLVGDVKYGSRHRDCPIALWSHGLGFTHPSTGEELRYELPPENIYPWTEFSQKGDAL